MADHGLIVRFYSNPTRNPAKSEEAGRDIWEDREWVNIIFPGDRSTEIDCEAEEKHRTGYPVEYARFKNNEAEKVIGTPLAEWSAMPRSLVKEFEYLNVRTLEQLAALSDTAKQAFGMGALEWQRKAQVVIDAAKDSAAALKATSENEALKREITDLKRQIAEIGSAQVERRGPGRPPKQDAA